MLFYLFSLLQLGSNPMSTDGVIAILRMLQLKPNVKLESIDVTVSIHVIQDVLLITGCL